MVSGGRQVEADMKGHWSESGRLMSCVEGVDDEHSYGDEGCITVRPKTVSACDICVMFSDGSGLVAPFKSSKGGRQYISKANPNWSDGTWYLVLLYPRYPRTAAYWIEDEFTTNPLCLQDYGLEPSAVVPSQGQAHDE